MYVVCDCYKLIMCFAGGLKKCQLMAASSTSTGLNSFLQFAELLVSTGPVTCKHWLLYASVRLIASHDLCDNLHAVLSAAMVTQLVRRRCMFSAVIFYNCRIHEVRMTIEWALNDDGSRRCNGRMYINVGSLRQGKVEEQLERDRRRLARSFA